MSQTGIQSRITVSAGLGSMDFCSPVPLHVLPRLRRDYPAPIWWADASAAKTHPDSHTGPPPPGWA